MDAIGRLMPLCVCERVCVFKEMISHVDQEESEGNYADGRTLTYATRKVSP